MFIAGRSSTVMRSPHSNPDPHHRDDNRRPTQVYVLGSGLPRMCPVQAHWAAAFDFQDGTVLIAELTAASGRGEVWNENHYTITNILDLEVEGVHDLNDFLSTKNYEKLSQDGASPHELHRRCSMNCMNGEYYSLFFNNCQRWVVILLHGYGIDHSHLPCRCGRGCRTCSLICGIGFLLSVAMFDIFCIGMRLMAIFLGLIRLN